MQIKANNSRGFTLIELLVVVLIIGILASIALPQYRKAVEKARAVQVISFANAAQKAISVWIMNHGELDNVDFIREDLLDINIKAGWDCPANPGGYGFCRNQFYIVDASCTAGGSCTIQWERIEGDEHNLHMKGQLTTTDGKEWRSVSAYNTELGRASCQLMATAFNGECVQYQ